MERERERETGSLQITSIIGFYSTSPKSITVPLQNDAKLDEASI
jgi:hypothetical protein